MKFKKAIIFICLIVCFLSIACVSAGDVDDTIATGSYDQIENQENIGMADDETLSESTGTFSDLAHEIANADGELTLTRNYAYDDSSMMMNSTLPEDSFYIYGIDIDKEITINGNGFTIDGRDQASVFNVNYDNVVLKNIIFVNTYSFEDGGAVYWNGNNGTLAGCSFLGCYAYDEGGAVFWNRSAHYGVLSDCNFVGCSAGRYRGDAGAVYWHGYNGVLSNCSFTNCHALSGAGAIYWCAADCVMSDSSFVDCSARYGGAVEWGAQNGVLNGCNFINCSAEYDGGAVDWNWNDGILSNCSFVDCSASEKGGAVRWKDKNGVLSDCTFINCSSSEWAGAIFWSGKFGELSNCSFVDCSALEYGGAVFWTGVDGTLSDCSFVDCSASYDGGAIYWDESGGFLANSTFVNCSSSEYDAVYGIVPTDCKFMEKPFISISPVTVKYGQNAKVTVNLASDVPGNVRFTVNGITEKVKITNGKATYTVSGLKVGTYDVKVTYAGNYKYIADTISTSIKVNKNNPIVSAKANDCSYGTNAIITVNLAQNVPGNVRITVNGVQYVCKINDCVASASIPGLRVGSYPVTISYAGNVNYNAQTIQKTLNVVKGTPIISVSAPDAAYGKNAKITVNLANDVPGNVWFTINGVSEKVKITNAKATYTVSGLKTGSYEVTVRYGGNVNYNAQTIKKTLNIVKANPITSVSVGSINVGDTAIVTVNFQNNVNGFVKITVNGVTERVQIANGVASASFSNLKAGTYDVSAVFAGGTNYNTQTATANFTVTKSSPGLIVAKRTVEGKTVLIASIAEDATGYVNFAVNGGTYKAKIVNGEATLTLPDFAPGTYTLKSSYGGNYKYLAETKTRTITVK